jgi:CRISPR system Cascade subunit CasD
MTSYLVFQLYGPLASWGDIAVGETRPSSLGPSRSAVLGLIAAALGLERPDTMQDEQRRVRLDEEHRQLAIGYGIATRLELIGSRLVDYHTAQVSPAGTGRNRRRFSSRRDELGVVDRRELKTVLSQRDYRQDAFAAVAMWTRAGAPHSLESLCKAMQTPRFSLYLGRKSCPPALPLRSEVLEASCIEEALVTRSFVRAVRDLWGASEFGQSIADRMSSGPAILFWDTDASVRLDSYQAVPRRDDVLSRHRWQFTMREERQSVTAIEGYA